MVEPASWVLLLILSLLGDDTYVEYMGKVHGESGILWCVAASFGIFGGEVGSLGREGGAWG